MTVAPASTDAPANAGDKDRLAKRDRPRSRVTIPAAVAPLLLEFPSLDAQLWVLAGARLVVTASFSAVMPFLAMHLAVDRGISVLRIGMLWTIVGGVSAATQLLAGGIADRFGRRLVMLVGMLLRAANLGVLGWAIGAQASFGTIAALCLANGVLRALYDPVASAVVASLASPNERVAAFSLHRVGSSIGWAAGPLTATLASSAAYSTLFYVCAPLNLLAAVAIARIPETRPSSPKPRVNARARVAELLAFRTDPHFVRFLRGTFAFFLVQTQMYHLMSIYAAKELGLDRAHVGTLYTLNGIVVVLLQLPAVRFIGQLGTRGALVLGSLGFLGSYVACAFAVDYLSLLACFAFMTASEIIAMPAQQAAVTALAPPDKVTSYAGVFGLFQGAAQTVGPLVGTILLETAHRWSWLVLALMAASATWLYRPRRVVTRP